MRTFSRPFLQTRFAKQASVLLFSAALVLGLSAPVLSQTALSAVTQMGNLFAGGDTGVSISHSEMISALEGAAEAGQPMALWQLGEMYENGVGVEQDSAKAFGYFSQIANKHASAPPHSLEADIVARSFVKIGDYYKVGLPDAGIAVDQEQARQLLFHAASYFGDADAQYRVGLLYLNDEAIQTNALLSRRWLSLAAHKGHVPAQAVLGDLMFNGHSAAQGGFAPQPVEGLMWLTLAHEGTFGSDDEVWIGELLTRAMSVATSDQRSDARDAADTVRSQVAKN